ncbi:MAG: hypothetical protein KGI71_05785 [Patescibacteria group bacterium]|nr:hypothetical protein [Patescibacteria group bacterium]
MADETEREALKAPQPCAVCGKMGSAKLCGVHGMEFLQSPMTQMVLPHGGEAEMEMAFVAYLVMKKKAK